jgi:CheY-like chemotaxis protein
MNHEDEPGNKLLKVFDASLNKPICASEMYNVIVSPRHQIAETQVSQPSSESYSLSPVKVLLVEDNKINQQVATLMLEKFNCDVTLAENGIEAIDILSAQNGGFDLVLMDCQMPEMDGYEATERIRSGLASEAAMSLPIIALTANAMEGDKDKCLAHGMTDYITKPVQPMVLKQILDQYSGAQH